MTKIEKVLKDYDNAQTAKAALKSEIEKLKGQITQLEQEADQAAEAEDLKLYKAKKADMSDLADRIAFKTRRLNKTSCELDQKEVREAWAEYAKAHDKAFEKTWAAYLQQRKDLFASFMQIVMDQNEALKLREKCATMIGLDPDPNDLQKEGVIQRTFVLNTIPTESGINYGNPQLRTADTDFFLSAGMADKDKDLTLLNQIVRLRRPF